MNSSGGPTPFSSANVLGRGRMRISWGGMAPNTLQFLHHITRGGVLELAMQVKNGEGLSIKDLIYKGAIQNGISLWFIDNYIMPYIAELTTPN